MGCGWCEQELSQKLEADLQNLFTEKGIDLDLYDENVVRALCVCCWVCWVCVCVCCVCSPVRQL